MASLSRYTARQLNQFLQRSGKFWQPGYYDRAVRNLNELMHTVHYVHMNPVEERLVRTPEEWRFSSAYPEFSDLIDWDWIAGIS